MTEEKTSSITPTVGRMIYYKLSEQDVQEINRRRNHATKKMEEIKNMEAGYQVHVGNEVKIGDILPAVITVIHSTELINAKVFLDGNDDFWVASIHIGQDLGNWDWMPYQKGQAKKTEDLEEENKELKK